MAALEVAIEQSRPIALHAALQCERGELLALVGPSGSGKSTVLKTIAGLLSRAHGQVRVNGRAWLDSSARIHLPAHRRKVGFVFQSYALFPHLSALENVMAGAPQTGHAGRGPALAWLEAVHMRGLEHRRPSQLSGGQQQRVALARALAREPEVLLLDEPFSAVDQMTRERLYEELAALRRRFSVPTVFVTHSIPEAQMLADRMVVLHHGRTLQSGTPDEVYRHPAEADVARLMGHRNIFAARLVRRSAEGSVLDWRGIELRSERHGEPGAVSFVVPGTDVRIVDPDAHERRINQIDGTVVAITPLGDVASVRVELSNRELVALSAPRHIIARRALVPGGPIQVALLPAAVHLMKPGRP